MELKIDLIVQNSDITFDNEIETVSKWNIENTSNQIYYIKGYLETNKGSLDVVSEKFSIQHSYLYNPNPTIKPSVYFALNGNVVSCDYIELDKLIGDAGSVVIGLMRYAETLALSKKIMQEKSTDIIIVNNGEIFEGTRDQFANCFFSNADNYQIIDWCKQNGWNLSINGINPKKEDFSWIKVNRFDESKYATIEEKYQALQKHHQEEVGFLIDYINKNCKK